MNLAFLTFSVYGLTSCFSLLYDYITLFFLYCEIIKQKIAFLFHTHTHTHTLIYIYIYIMMLFFI